MIKIGVTGGIGSGKTVVCDLLRLHDVPVFDADKEAKQLNDTSPQVREALTNHFGDELYEGGKLNRQKLASLIFNDKRNLSIANSIIHPALADRFNEWCSDRMSSKLVAIDAAVLFEAGFEAHVDTVVVVYSPKELRLKRVMKRDKVDMSKVEARMRNQLPEEEKMERANHIIHNDGHHSIIVQVADLLQDLTILLIN